MRPVECTFMMAKSRLSAPKSRNGCLNCKKRHMKCDETKPNCNRCVYSRRCCEWKLPTDLPKMTRDIIPQARTHLSHVRPSQLLPFIDEKETYYFSAYQREVASELAGAVKSSPWTYSLLRAAHTEPFVLRSLVALGALSRAVKLSHIASDGPIALKDAALKASCRHREFTLAAYDKAILGMLNIMTCSRDTATAMRQSLLACILVFTMELFLSIPNSAFVHAQSGLFLLRQLESAKPHWNSGVVSPDANIVEDEIYQEFSRLELMTTQRWPDRDVERHGLERLDGSEAISGMPGHFGSLEEARVYHQLILRQIFHLVSEAYGHCINSKLEERHPIAGDTPGEWMDPCHMPSQLLRDRDGYTSNIHRWLLAIQPIFPHLITSKDTQTSTGAALLKCQILQAEIALAGAFITIECDFDRFLPSFCEIVALSDLVLKNTNARYPKDVPIFDLNMSFAHPLQDVATFCRDREVRLQTLDILREMAPRDAAKYMHRIWTRASYPVMLEEVVRERHGGEIPEEARWRMIWVLHHYGDEERHLTVACARRTGYPIGQRYPAQREMRFRLFTCREVEAMRIDEGPGPKWNFGVNKWYPSTITKPMGMACVELHEELLRVVPRIE